MNYTVLRGPDGVVLCIQRSDGAMIPLDSKNLAYQDFLVWNSKQATPDDLKTHRPDGWVSEDQYLLQQAKALAKAGITSQHPEDIKIRNIIRVIYASLIETRNKINEIVAKPTVNIQPLTNRTWAQAIAAVSSQIDSETDPMS